MVVQGVGSVETYKASFGKLLLKLFPDIGLDMAKFSSMKLTSLYSFIFFLIIAFSFSHISFH